MLIRLILTSAALYGVLKLAWTLLRNHVIKTATIQNDLKRVNLGVRSQGQKFHGAAVIAGGSTHSGEYFTKVIIVEPDPRLILKSPRAGQRAHLHNILPIALVALRKFFSNFDDEARKAGGTIRDAWTRWHLGKHRLFVTPADNADILHLSRLSLEILVRRLVQEHATSPIEFIQGTVTGVKASSDGKLIESITYRPIENPELAGSGPLPSFRSIPTAFFADCSGASFTLVKMLPAAGVGWGPFTRHHYNPSVSYRTALVNVPEKARDAIARAVPQGDIDYGRWDKMTLIDTFTPTFDLSNEMFAIQKLDGNRLCLLHNGWGVESLARNFSEYVQAVEDIQVKFLGRDTPEKKKAEYVLDVLKILEDSVEDIDNAVEFVSYKMSHCEWYDFENAALPANFAPLGDAKMRVNPAFGQGVTKLLGDAIFLNSTLADFLLPGASEIPANTSKEHLKRAFKVATGMFDVNKMLDYGYASTTPEEGETLAYGDWLRRYWVALLDITGDDRWAARTLNHVLSGTSPGIDMFHPLLLLKVFLRSWFGFKV